MKKIKYKITTYTQLGKGQSKYLRRSKKRKKNKKQCGKLLITGFDDQNELITNEAIVWVKATKKRSQMMKKKMRTSRKLVRNEMK